MLRKGKTEAHGECPVQESTSSKKSAKKVIKLGGSSPVQAVPTGQQAVEKDCFSVSTLPEAANAKDQIVGHSCAVFRFKISFSMALSVHFEPPFQAYDDKCP